ncbi:putative Ig domain-containing protein, partial [Patescibacteria group bacterium]|nr:putative Ig domain-containing protein [Patescibacteria group bacterium]
TLNTATLSDGWHRIQVDAVDAVGNRSDSIEVRVNVRGPGGPSIASAVVHPKWGMPDDIFCMEADVIDGDGIARVQAVIQYPDETIVDRINMTLVSGNTYHGDWDSTGFLNVAYYVDIEAEDNLGNISELENILGGIGSCQFGPQPPIITSSLTFTAFEGTSFSYFITALNSPTSYACSGAGLPAWVSCNAVTGEVSGTPPSVGSFDFSITAANANGDDTQTLDLTVEIFGGGGGGSCSECSNNYSCGYSSPGTCDDAPGCDWNFAFGTCESTYNCDAFSGNEVKCTGISICTCNGF